MPKTKPPQPNQDAFYVYNSGDDFTFYLNRKSETSNDKPGELRKRLEFQSGDGLRKELSFSETVSVLCLALTPDSLKVDDGLLWAELARNKKIYCKLASLQRLLSRRTRPDSDPGSAILEALNAAINGPSLENEKWITGLAASEKDFLKSLNAQPPVLTKWRNRLLLEKTFPRLIQKTLIKKTAGRALFCLTNGGDNISVTFRGLKDKSGFDADRYSHKRKRIKNLFSIGEYCDLIYKGSRYMTSSQK